MTKMHKVDEARAINEELQDLSARLAQRSSRLAELSASIKGDHRDRVGEHSAAYFLAPHGSNRSEVLVITPLYDIAKLRAARSRMVAMDTETTGLDYTRYFPYSIVIGDREFRGRESRPGVPLTPIHPSASAVNGMSQEDIERLEPYSVDNLEQLASVLSAPGVILVGHNITFDLNHVLAMLDRAGGIVFPSYPEFVDTQVLFKQLHRGAAKTSLDACLAHYGLTRTTGVHAADEDAMLTMQLLDKLLSE